MINLNPFTNNNEVEEREEHFEVVLLNEIANKLNKFSDLLNFNIRNLENTNIVILDDFLNIIDGFIYEVNDTSLNKVNEVFKNNRKSPFSNRADSIKTTVSIQYAIQNLIKSLEKIEKIDRGFIVLIIQRILYRYSGVRILKERQQINTIFTYKFFQERINNYLLEETNRLSLLNNNDELIIESLYDVIFTHRDIINEFRIKDPKLFSLVKNIKQKISKFNFELFSELTQFNLSKVIDFDSILYNNIDRDYYLKSIQEKEMMNRIKNLSSVFFFDSKTSYTANKLIPEINDIDHLGTIGWFDKYAVISSEIIDSIEKALLKSSQNNNLVPTHIQELTKYFKKIISLKYNENKSDEELILLMLEEYYTIIKPFTSITSEEGFFKKFLMMLKDQEISSIYALTDGGESTEGVLSLNSTRSLESRYNHYLFDKLTEENHDKLPSFIIMRTMFIIISIIGIERVSELYDYTEPLYDALPISLVSDLIVIRD